MKQLKEWMLVQYVLALLFLYVAYRVQVSGVPASMFWTLVCVGIAFYILIRKPLSDRNESPSPETEALQHVGGEHSPSTEPTEKEMFQSPSLLAGWVNKFILEPIPLSKDYELLPDEENRKALNISFEQIERCVREYSILRTAGISKFVQQHYPDSFWLTFNHSVTPHLCRHLYAANSEDQSAEVARALHAYVESADDIDKCASLFMTRVYDDNDHYIRMSRVGVGFTGVDRLHEAYESFRDCYCKVTQGFSYQSLDLITKALDEIEKAKDTPSAST